MSKLIKRIVRYGISKARKNSIVRSVLEEATPKKSYKAFGRFSDSRGNVFQLLEGLRDELKPGWQTTLEPWTSRKMPSNRDLKIRMSFARSSVRKMLRLLDAYSFCVRGKSVLEIGCSDGATTRILAQQGTKNVVGSDILAYYLHARPGSDGIANSPGEHANALAALREHFRKAISASGGTDKNVTFVEDNISSSNLASGTFDLICSWEVLEHVQNPEAAFDHMYRLLKPGGIAFHEYNPFFSLTGGHALCTLDFHWGHTRLDEKDFMRYLQEIRPGETGLARHSYEYNLNRMSLSDLDRYGRKSGFKILSRIDWSSKKHLELVDSQLLNQTIRVFPSASILDLITPSVWIVHKKP